MNGIIQLSQILRRMRRLAVPMSLLALPIVYIIGSEVHDAERVSPRGGLTVLDFFNRIGEPGRIRKVWKDGQSCCEFTGLLPSGMTLAFPSGSSVYFFDEGGRFVARDREPGETIKLL